MNIILYYNTTLVSHITESVSFSTSESKVIVQWSDITIS